jgi:hypothetical protein
LNCNPIPTGKPAPKKDEAKYVDVPWTKERILDAIRDDVQGWIEDWFSPNGNTADSADTVVAEVDWRTQAKELGINLFQKKKSAVLVEIANKLSEKSDEV